MPPLPIPQDFKAIDLEIANELASLGVRDLSVRETEPADSPKIDQIDLENAERLKEILAEIKGWPAISRFGTETPKAAWLVALHATHNPAFQADCLRQMMALPANEYDLIDRVYLEDRVLISSGQPQRYGTIWNVVSNPAIDEFDVVPSRMEDPANVDARRAQVGLPPLAPQKAQMWQALIKPETAAPASPVLPAAPPPPRPLVAPGSETGIVK